MNQREEEKGRERGGRARLVDYACRNETAQDLDRWLSFMLAEEPIKLEQVNAEPRFRNASCTSLALLPFSLPSSSSNPICLLIKGETWNKSSYNTAIGLSSNFENFSKLQIFCISTHWGSHIMKYLGYCRRR